MNHNQRKQSRTTLRRPIAGLAAAGLLAVSWTGAYGQVAGPDASPGRSISVVPRVSISETWTDNVRLSTSDPQHELISELSPGVHIVKEGGRLNGYFDYALSEIAYSNGSSPHRTQQALNAFGTLEAVDNWAFLEVSGGISQQSISALGTPLLDKNNLSPNQTEVATLRVSPFVRGRVGDWMTYEARWSRAATNSDGATGTDVTADDSLLRAAGDSPFRGLGWSALASRQRADYNSGRATDADRWNLGLSYAITPQLRAYANVGKESNNYTSLDKQQYDTRGVGVNWSVSDATTLAAQIDHQFFGDGHAVSFEHRTPRTVWRYTDTKGVSVTPSQAGVGSLGSIYDLLYAQFASLEPNPVSRAQLVNSFLQLNSISPSAVVTSGFLTSAVSLQHRQDLAFALLGVRDTVTFMATRSENTRLDTLSTAFDDLSNSSTVIQRGFSVSYAHRLTPELSIAVLAAQQNTVGTQSAQEARVQSLNVNLTGRVGQKTFASVAVRRILSNGSIAPYSETALTLNLNLQF